MFGNRKKKAKASDSDFDFDFDMDFDMEDFGDGLGSTPPNNRSPVFQNTVDFGKGAAKSFAEPSNIKRLMRGLLPNEYGQYIDSVEQAGQSVRADWDEITSQIQSTKRSLSKSLSKGASLAERVAPEKIGKFINKFVEKEESYSHNKTASRDEEIDSNIALMFGKAEQAEAAREKLRERKDEVKMVVDNKRHKDLSMLLASIDNTAQMGMAFTNKNTMAYYKASIKIKMQMYNIMVDQLAETKESNRNVLSALNDIKKNSGLPDAVKQKGSEEFLKMTRDKFHNSVHARLFGSGSYLSNLAKSVTGAVKERIGGLKDMSDQIEMALGMTDGMGGMEGMDDIDGMPSKYETAGNMTASTFMGGLGQLMSKKFNKTKLGKKILKGTAKASYFHDNMGDIITNKLEDGSIKNKIFKQKTNEFGDAEERPLVDALFNFLGSVSRDARNKGRELKFDRANFGMYGSADKTDLNSKALTSVIPGYLARILREVTSMRTGRDDIELLEFNYNKDTFSKSSQNAKEVILHAVGVDNIRAMSSFRGTLENQLGLKQGELSPEESRYVMTVMSQAVAKGQEVDEKFLNDRRNFPMLPKEKFKLLKRSIGKRYKESKNFDGTEDEYVKKDNILNTRKLITQSNQSMRVDKAVIDGIVNAGYAPHLQNAGLMDSKGNVDTVKFLKFITEFKYDGGAADENVRNALDIEEQKRHSQGKGGFSKILEQAKNILKTKETRKGQIGDILDGYENATVEEFLPSKGDTISVGSGKTKIIMPGMSPILDSITNTNNIIQHYFTKNNEYLKQMSGNVNDRSDNDNTGSTHFENIALNTRDTNVLLAQVLDKLDSINLIQQVSAPGALDGADADKNRGIFSRMIRANASFAWESAKWTGRKLKNFPGNVRRLGRGLGWLARGSASIAGSLLKLPLAGVGMLGKGIYKAGGWMRNKVSDMGINKKLDALKAKYGEDIEAMPEKARAEYEKLKGKLGQYGAQASDVFKEKYSFAKVQTSMALGKFKKDAINLYSSTTGKVIITAKGIKNGRYLNDKLEPIKSIRDITTDIYDTETDEIISLTDIKDSVIEKMGKFKPLSAVMNIGKGLFNAGASMLGLAKGGTVGVAMWAGKKVLSLAKKAGNIQLLDIYLAGQKEPVLKASFFRKGAYYSSKTFKPIYSSKEIDSDVLDADGNEIVSLKELSKGMFDKWGNPIGGFFRTNWSLTKKVAGSVWKAGKSLLSAAKNITVGAFKTGKNLLGKMWKGTKAGYNKLAGNITDAASAGVATVMAMGETNTLLTSILTMLDERLPGKKIFGDSSGDGIVDGSIKDLKNKAKEKANKKEGKNKGKDDSGFFGKTMKSLMGLFGKNKDEEEEEDDGLGLSDLADAASGGDGGSNDSDKDKEKKRKQKRKRRLRRMRRNRAGGRGGVFRRMGQGISDTVGRGRAAAAAATAGRTSKLGKGLGLAAAGGKGLAKGAWGITKGAARLATSMPGKAMMMGGKMIPLAGAGLGAMSLASNLSQGNYGAAAIDAGLTAWSLGSAGVTLGGIGSAAATLGPLLFNPVTLGVLGVAAVGYGAYKLWKYWKKTSVNEKGKARLMIYGVDYDKNKEQAEKVLEFEAMMEENLKKGDDPNNIDMEQVCKIFGLEAEDTEMLTRFKSWFDGRFSPAFKKIRDGMNMIKQRMSFEEANELKDTEEIKYFQNIKPRVGEFTSLVSPFKEMSELTVTNPMAMKFIDDILAKLDKNHVPGAVAGGPATAEERAEAMNKKIAEMEKNNGLGNVDVNSKNFSEIIAARQGMDPNDIAKSRGQKLPDATLLGAGAAGMATVPMAKNVEIKSGETLGFYDMKEEPFRFGMFKVYGLSEMNTAQIQAIMATEKQMYDLVQFRGKQAVFNGNLAELANKVARYFNIDAGDQAGPVVLQHYLENRFIPVFLAMANVAKEHLNSFGLESINNANPAVKKLILEGASYANTSKGGSVFEWGISPWKDKRLNTDISSIKGDLEALEKEVNASGSGSAKAALNNRDVDKADTKKSWWDSVKDTASNIKDAVGGFVSDTWNNLKQAGSDLMDGKGVVQTVQNLGQNQYEAATNAIGTLKGTNKENFQKIYNAAKAAGDPHPAVVAAQWAVESNWGKRTSGKYNYFGIKAQKGEPGSSVTTHEVLGGNRKKIVDRFKDYGSLEEGIQDRVAFVRRNQRYTKAGYFNAKTPMDATAALQNGGFATDPGYAKLLNKVMRMGGIDPGVVDKQTGIQTKVNTVTPNTKPDSMAKGGMLAAAAAGSSAASSGVSSSPATNQPAANSPLPAALTSGASGNIAAPSGGAGSYAGTVQGVVASQVPTSHRAYKAAEYATRNAHAKSQGLCARYVASALLNGGGYKFTRNASAYMYANGTLAKAGFTKIPNNSQFQTGDVIVWPAHGGKGGGGIHGHIQIYNGKQWLSDFRQNTIVPGGAYRASYNSGRYTVWRDSDLVKGGVKLGSVTEGAGSDETKDTKTDTSAPDAGSNGGVTNSGYNTQEAMAERNKQRAAMEQERAKKVGGMYAGVDTSNQYGGLSSPTGTGTGGTETISTGYNSGKGGASQSRGSYSGYNGNQGASTNVGKAVEDIQGRIRNILGIGNDVKSSITNFKENIEVRKEAYKRANETAPKAAAEMLKVSNALGKDSESVKSIREVADSVMKSKEVKAKSENIPEAMLAEAKLQTKQLMEQTKLLQQLVGGGGLMGKTSNNQETKVNPNTFKDLVPTKEKPNPVSMGKGNT